MIRRKFLKLMGLGAASAPIAAKATTEELTSLRGSSAPMLASGINFSNSASPGIGNPTLDMGKYLTLFRDIPEFQLEKIKDRSKNVYHLDPDLAAKKSWSMCVKIQEQQQRNYQKEIQRYYKSGKLEQVEIAFEKVSGFRWPW